MARTARFAVSVVLIISSALAVYRLCYVPYRCNRTTHAIRVETEAAFRAADAAPDNFAFARGARNRLAIAQECLSPVTARVDLYMLAAANARLLKNSSQAIDYYRAALRLERRPEIYFNLGVTEAEAGEREQGIKDLVIAGRTGSYWNQIEDEPLRNEVTRRLFYVPPTQF